MSESLEKKPKKDSRCFEAILYLFSSEKKEKFLHRFWSKVNRKGPDDCWEWKASTMNGYGAIMLSRKYIIPTSHRLSWVLTYNTVIPKGLFVCHTCDNKICCNPEHLFLGTHKTNVKDRDLKGRCGGKWLKSKISTKAKEDIIISLMSNTKSALELSILYKITANCARDKLALFLKGIKDRSFLPEPLKTRYAHCRSLKEFRELQIKYDEQDRQAANNNTIQATYPL